MLRVAIILLLVCLLWRWALGKWPWQMLSGPPTRAERIRSARRLLEVEHGASRDDILAAHKRVLSKVHPDRGGSSAQVHDANDARDLLLSDLPMPAPRSTNDDSLRD